MAWWRSGAAGSSRRVTCRRMTACHPCPATSCTRAGGSTAVVELCFLGVRFSLIPTVSMVCCMCKMWRPRGWAFRCHFSSLGTPARMVTCARLCMALCRVADVQFVRGSGGLDPSSSSSGTTASSLLLLSAGNDGALCLWDLSRAAETGGIARGGRVVPQCLARSTHLHTGGLTDRQ